GLRVSRLAVGVVLLMAGASLLGSTSASGAAMTYVVNSTDDEANASPTSTVCASGSGLCTLRAAIQAANKNPGTDTILLSTPGAGDGGGISSGATATNQVATLNLINVVVTQNTPGGFGGGIANTDVLSLTDATVSDNTSGTGSGFGGGIYNAGTATLNRVTVSGNAAGGGGGLGSDFDITLTNVTISGNTASSGAALM